MNDVAIDDQSARMRFGRLLIAAFAERHTPEVMLRLAPVEAALRIGALATAIALLDATTCDGLHLTAPTVADLKNRIEDWLGLSRTP